MSACIVAFLIGMVFGVMAVVIAAVLLIEEDKDG